MAASLCYPPAQQGEGVSDLIRPNISQTNQKSLKVEIISNQKKASGASCRMSFTLFFYGRFFFFFSMDEGEHPHHSNFLRGGTSFGVIPRTLTGWPRPEPPCALKKVWKKHHASLFLPQKKSCPSRGPSAECLRVCHV